MCGKLTELGIPRDVQILPAFIYYTSYTVQLGLDVFLGGGGGVYFVLCELICISFARHLLVIMAGWLVGCSLARSPSASLLWLFSSFLSLIYSPLVMKEKIATKWQRHAVLGRFPFS